MAGEIHEGEKTVVYETWYQRPGPSAWAKGARGVAARLSIDDQTVALSPGVGYPAAWDTQDGQVADYPVEFWQAVLDKFSTLPVDPDYAADHAILRESLNTLREATAKWGKSSSQAATLQATPEQDANGVPIVRDPERAWESPTEAEYSRAVGERAAATYHAQQQLWERSNKYGPLDPRNALNRGYPKQNRLDGWEFRQVIELWKQHAFGTGYDHSGTKAYTLRRRRGTQDGWTLYNRPYFSCNHGACPGEESMRPYETCDSGVVMDWYANDGECEGNWMSGHLCNDDTSMQINHAQGIWTGNACPGAKRGIAPRCGRQFK